MFVGDPTPADAFIGKLADVHRDFGHESRALQHVDDGPGPRRLEVNNDVEIRRQPWTAVEDHSNTADDHVANVVLVQQSEDSFEWNHQLCLSTRPVSLSTRAAPS